MSRRIKSLAAFALLLCVCITVGFAADQKPKAPATKKAEEPLVANPIYASWSKHKPGTEIVVEAKTADGEITFVGTISYKLVEVTPDKVTLEQTMDMTVPGVEGLPFPQGQVSKESVKAKVPQSNVDKDLYGDGTMEYEVTEAGKAKVKAAGKSYDCKVYEFTGSGTDKEKSQSSGKVWRNDDVPGCVVKREGDSTGGGQKNHTNTFILKKVTLK